MFYKEIDTTDDNDFLLSIIEKNCQLATSARNEIKNSEMLLKQKKTTVIETKKDNFVVETDDNLSKTDSEFEDTIKYFLQDYSLLEEGFDEEELFDMLPSKKLYRHKDILYRLIAESNKEIIILNEFASDSTIKSADLKDIKSLILNEKRKIDLVKEFLNKKEEKVELNDEKNSLILVPTTGGNIRILSELESMPIEYMPLFKELVDSIVDGTFKNVKGFNNNNTLNGVSEVKGPGVRIVFKRLSKNKYALITAFIKRSNNDMGYQDSLRSKVADFRLIHDGLKANLDNQEFIDENNKYVLELYRLLGQDDKKPQNSKGVM